MNPLRLLQEHGQSVWLDYIRRSLIATGELRRLVQEDGLSGVTSNPAIFEKAIASSGDYAGALEELQRAGIRDPAELYDRLAIRDVQDAADVLRPVYAATGRRDGFVSLEVSPHLARDTAGTVAEARRLWRAVGRPNLMVKVPGTHEGVAALERLVAEGVNVNVTLLFSLATYEQVVEAYLRGLEERARLGLELGRVASVASFFVSRVDAAVEALLEGHRDGASGDGAGRPLHAAGPEPDRLARVAGRAAIANARLAHARYRALFSGPRWEALARGGARTQRLLWASTGTKNPAYRDVLYVEELIGPDTVTTLPPAALDAFRDHGRPRASLEEDPEGARATLQALDEMGLSMRQITERLLEEGLALFRDAFDRLFDALDRRCRRLDTRAGAVLETAAAADRPPAGPESSGNGGETGQAIRLDAGLRAAVDQSLDDWSGNHKARRLWARDASLWTGADEGRWLDWLGITDEPILRGGSLDGFARELRAEGFRHVLLLGMGGSSLCPDVMRQTFGPLAGFPELLVLDSTDPAQVRSCMEKTDPGRMLVIVSSKSGTTLEPSLLRDHFLERARATLGLEAGRRFVAITDPGSPLQAAARRDGFRRVFLGAPGIGGRYSALSPFGTVPAAAMGLDVKELLDRAHGMAEACAACVPARENPGVALGAVLGTLAARGRDKVTLVASPAIATLGAWLEQLLAESTGKRGKGLIPVDGEPLGEPDAYGGDRLFVYLRLSGAAHPAQDAAVDALERAGHPVVRIALSDRYDVAREFFRWEFVTAVAGSILGLNPFDQPDVEASKTATRQLMAEVETTGALPPERPVVEERGLRLFAGEAYAAALSGAAGDGSLVGLLRTHLRRLRPGGYFAILAFLEMKADHERPLQDLRRAVRDAGRVATCLGFGPRFLHSTGQAYKGGPATGVFLQITCDDAADVRIPARPYTFGAVRSAQARGDFQVLAERGRPILRVHLPADIGEGLARLQAAVQEAVAGLASATRC